MGQGTRFPPAPPLNPTGWMTPMMSQAPPSCGPSAGHPALPPTGYGCMQGAPLPPPFTMGAGNSGVPSLGGGATAPPPPTAGTAGQGNGPTVPLTSQQFGMLANHMANAVHRAMASPRDTPRHAGPTRGQTPEEMLGTRARIFQQLCRAAGHCMWLLYAALPYSFAVPLDLTQGRWLPPAWFYVRCMRAAPGLCRHHCQVREIIRTTGHIFTLLATLAPVEFAAGKRILL